MAELIDKERAYTALKHEQYTHGLSFSAEAFEKAARIIDQMPTIEAEPVNRWIPCSERLPEKHVEVLAYSPYWGKIVVAMWGGEFWLEQWTDDDLEQSEITHWMPLPELPEGGADNAAD